MITWLSTRLVVLCVAAAAAVAGCGLAPSSTGALPPPPEDGGVSVDDALRTGASGWIRGFLVERAGERVRLCATLKSTPPSCDGASLELADGVLWRLPSDPHVFGGVRNGLLTNTMDDPEDPNDAQPCTFGSNLGPCAAFPYLQTSASVIWSDHEYSVIGTVVGHTLVELREMAP